MEEIAEGARDKFTVGPLPTIIYVPNFITSSEEEHLLHQINSAPISKWKALKNRRLQNWGGVVHEKGLLPQALPPWLSTITERIWKWTGLFPSPINHVLINEYLPGQGIMLRLQPHQDGPTYFPVVAILSLGSPAVMSFTPHPKLIEPLDSELMSANQTVCMHPMFPLNSSQKGSYGQHQTSLKRSEKENGRSQNYHDALSVVLMPCSLLIFKDSAYEDYLHGIEECNVHEVDKAVNINAVCGGTSNNTCVTHLYTDNGIQNLQAPSLKQKATISRTGTRISLTCRLVPKVHKNLIKL